MLALMNCVFISFRIVLFNVFLFVRNAGLVVCNACVTVLLFCIFVNSFFTLDSTNVYPIFCLAESKQILQLFWSLYLVDTPTASQWLQFAMCVRVARRIQKSGPSFVEHQDISSNDDVFLQNAWVDEEETLNVAEEIVTDSQYRNEVSELSVLMQTETMAMQYTAVQIDNLASDNALPFLNMERLQSDQKLLYYYAGQERVEKPYAVFATLGPALNNLTYFSLCCELISNKSVYSHAG
jgi:hypothetical protein